MNNILKINAQLACLAVTFCLGISWAADTEDWKKFQSPDGEPLTEEAWASLNEGDVLVELFDESGSKVKRVKAVAIIAFPAEEVYSTVKKVENFPDFMPYVDTVELLEPEGEHQRARFKLDFPWPVGNRHYIIKLINISDEKESETVFSSSWEYEPGSGNIVETEGSWVITTLDDAHCFVEYTVFTDPGGHIPVWLRNKATDAAIPKVIKQLRKAVEQARKKETE